ncbi:MAG: hypothetical protein OXI63_11240 [Candidatus Poribacteria bacterium]|nr:hypothetical protein [Candidatus Poribacteria bacterium]
MERKFDAHAYIDRIGKRLIIEFEEAGQATTPSLIGEARETPVREQLEQILPRGIAVGSGCVIDSHGNASQQTDVILYERDICPVFSVNNTPETTYYPCEGVIAVGEIKSALNTATLEDSFAKIASVKSLRRYIVTPPPELEFLPTGGRVIVHRDYGSTATPSVIRASDSDPESDEHKQIFGFVLAGKLKLKPPTLLEKYVELVYQTGDTLSPNIVITLTHGGVYPYNPQKKERLLFPQTASDFAYFLLNSGFRSLIHYIHFAYGLCQTSGLRAFDRYFMDGGPQSGSYGLSMSKKMGE